MLMLCLPWDVPWRVTTPLAARTASTMRRSSSRASALSGSRLPSMRIARWSASRVRMYPLDAASAAVLPAPQRCSHRSLCAMRRYAGHWRASLRMTRMYTPLARADSAYAVARASVTLHAATAASSMGSYMTADTRLAASSRCGMSSASNPGNSEMGTAHHMPYIHPPTPGVSQPWSAASE